ncbi:MAG: EAL domain-containing protein [Wenzhouxiangella sp.]|jgi:diguanylate cyclase (GGDEF)-like protein|nr:EAL domain-containing protein [Wenzhouxiangella sp.]
MPESDKTSTSSGRNHRISQLYAEQCAAEPIHLLGTVQPHGYLTVINLADETICQVSRGVVQHYSAVEEAEVLLDQPAADWIKPQDQSLSELLASLRDDVRTDISVCRRLSVSSAGAIEWDEGRDFECTGYRSGGYAVLEWVPFHYQTDEILRQLRTLSNFSQLLIEPAEDSSIDEYLTDAAEKLRKLSGYQRVMIYRFLPDWSGEILAEATGKDTSQRFIGMRFPASDIPPQARELYVRNRLRVLADVEAPADRLIPERLPDGQVLDQSVGLLRAMSQAHLTYLKNMEVRATLTISIIVEGRLWGMVACHHNAPLIPPRPVVQSMRSSAEMLSRVVSARVKDMSFRDFTERSSSLRQGLDQFAQHLASDQSMDEALKSGRRELCDTLSASHVGILAGGAMAVSFRATAQQLRVLKRCLRELVGQHQESGVRIWNQLPEGFDESCGFPAATAGMMVVRLPERSDGLMFWLRDELMEEVSWAGEPEKFVVSDGKDGVKLEPRRSFAVWRETVRSQCEQWTTDDQRLADIAARRMGESMAALSAQQLQRSLDWASSHDTLTSLPNRQSLFSQLTDRLDQSAVGVLLIDLDNFKQINDMMGHDVGDDVLVEVGSRLSSITRQQDLVGRLGGDEFLVLCRLTSDRVPAEEVEPVLARVYDALRKPIQHGDTTFQLDVSIGVAFSPEHGDHSKVLVKRADIALYEAKRLGRGRPVFYAEAMESHLHLQVDTENELAAAIDAGQLRLYYQPQIDLRSRRVIGCESLIRWQHPDQGLLMPAFFLPVAERGQLIHRLGRWVLDEAIRQLAIWNRELSPDFCIAFNVSFAQVRDGDLLSEVAQALGRSNVNPANLEIELTESSVLGDEEKSRLVINELKSMGMKVALDDFGTGYSSLSHIHRLDFDYIKIDRTFVMQLERDEQAQAVVRSLLNLAQNLRVQTIAEGVEKELHAKWLAEAGCDLAQGYLWSPAVPAEEFPDVVRRINQELVR